VCSAHSCNYPQLVRCVATPTPGGNANQQRACTANELCSGLTALANHVRWPDSASDHDKELYKARSEIECTFSLLKQARRFATRYEKTLRNYAAAVAIRCAWLWLRV